MQILIDIWSNFFVAKKYGIPVFFCHKKKTFYFEFSLLFSPYNGIINI